MKPVTFVSTPEAVDSAKLGREPNPERSQMALLARDPVRESLGLNMFPFNWVCLGTRENGAAAFWYELGFEDPIFGIRWPRPLDDRALRP